LSGTSEQERFDKYKELTNSRPIDVWKLSDHPEAKAPSDKLFSEFEAAGLSNTRSRNRFKDAMREAFKDLFGVDSKVDLKYNTIMERRKEKDYIDSFNDDPNFDPHVVDMNMDNIFEEWETSSTHETLLNDHYKYRS
jgi:hypothetical protein